MEENREKILSFIQCTYTQEVHDSFHPDVSREDVLQANRIKVSAMKPAEGVWHVVFIEYLDRIRLSGSRPAQGFVFGLRGELVLF
jgi:hypothetical protein